MSEKSDKMSRRQALGVVGGLVVGGVVGAAGGYYAGLASAPPAPSGPGAVTTTVTQTATVTASAAAGPKPFEDVSVWFFCGGTPGGSFESVVYNGALAAEKLWGPKMTYIWSDWDPEKMVASFKDGLAGKPDGIAVMGHPGDVALDTFIDQAFSQGTLVTSINTELPKAYQKYKAVGFGYVGQSLYGSGYTLGSACAKMLSLGKGSRALVWGLLAQETRGLRSKGCIDSLKDAGVTVDYLEITADVNKDATLGAPILTGYLSKNPDCKLVITDHGNLTATSEVLLTTAGKKPGEVWDAGFDLAPNTVKGIQDGYVLVTLDQQQWLQGYLPPLQICLTKKYGFSGLYIDTGGGLVTKDNVGPVVDLSKQGIR
jgi:simple sugar transport system substrate-binding protein